MIHGKAMYFKIISNLIDIPMRYPPYTVFKEKMLSLLM